MPMMISAFGLAVQLALPVPELEPLPRLACALIPPGPPLRVELAPVEDLELAWSGPRSPSQIARAVVAGSGWTAERGLDWDLRMDHALGRFHLDPAATLLRCTPRDQDDPAWRQLLLDTALVTASLV